VLNLESEHGPTARRTGGVTPDDSFQPIEFKELFCGTRHGNLLTNCSPVALGNQRACDLKWAASISAALEGDPANSNERALFLDPRRFWIALGFANSITDF
jgi:hypothetical protein